MLGGRDASIVKAEAAPKFESKRSECVPGGGCGTVTQSYVAVAPGRTTIDAERDLCGEALACPPDKRKFSVTVVVR
jgi:hypothetical protein